jgi:diaminopimelate decarboxylase
VRGLNGLSLPTLVEKYGSPLYIVSAATLRENYRAFFRAFSAASPRLRVAYSYKTNRLRSVLECLHAEGAWAEVASGFEYLLARHLGVPASRIVFNGPYKTQKELRRALREGALINVDHFDELGLVMGLAGVRSPGVGIRINLDTGSPQLFNRFGFSVESGEAMEAVRQLVEGGGQLLGLHLHLGSFTLNDLKDQPSSLAAGVRFTWPKAPDLYRRAVEKAVEFAASLAAMGIHLDYIDLGGGFPPASDVGPFVEATVEPLRRAPWRHSPAPSLILEPGRALVHDAMHLLTTVVALKTLPGGKKAAVVDAGVNLLPTALWSWPEVEPLFPHEGPREGLTLLGPLCLQTDLIAYERPFGPVKTGDLLIVKNVGAYNFSQSTDFIQPRPAVVMVDRNRVRLIRKKGSLAQLLGPEQVAGPIASRKRRSGRDRPKSHAGRGRA